MTSTVPPIVNEASEIELVEIETLHQHPDNPRLGNRAVIRDSIEAHGFYGSVLVQRSTRRILIGWHRTDVYRELGAVLVPVTWVDVDDDEALRIVAQDNRSSELGGFDNAKLLDVLEKLNDGARELEATGYTNDDLSRMIRESGRYADESTDFLGGGPDQQPDDRRDSGGDGSQEKRRDKPDPEREKFFQLAYTVNEQQREVVLAAIGQAKLALGDSRDTPVTSSQALVAVCLRYSRG